MKTPRRQFLATGATLGITGLAAGIPGAIGAEQKEAGEMEVSPAEDLMREHGVLKRILLVYGALGEDFEKREHELFGKDGFEEIVGRVSAIEKTLGIFDLSQFTAHT